MPWDSEDAEEDEIMLEQIRIDDLEDVAFLPDEGGATRAPNSRLKHYAARVLTGQRDYLWRTVERFKIIIMIAIALVVTLVLMTFVNSEDNTLPERLPDESIELAQQVFEQLANTTIPPFALTYAPIVILDREETYFPSDLSVHIQNTHPTLNFTPTPDTSYPLNLSNLDQLNNFNGGDVYLSSREPIVSLPVWLRGQKPEENSLRTDNATNCVIVVVEKELERNETLNKDLNVVDVFYLYFYSFNDGPRGLGRQVGNHIGDWEHNMIRFTDGIPTAIWYSQHGFGAAYTFDAVQKIGNRPVAFSARGSHSNWPEAMAHDFHGIDARIPSHLAFDYTSRGRIWDPTLSALFYTFNKTQPSLNPESNSSSAESGIYTPALPSQPTGFLYFNGQWGDQQLRIEDKGQEEIFGFFKWAGGPKGIGWGDKVMSRDNVCPDTTIPDAPNQANTSDKMSIRECIIRDSI